MKVFWKKVTDLKNLNLVLTDPHLTCSDEAVRRYLTNRNKTK